MPTFQPRNTACARGLRHAATPAERQLWRHLSRSQLGAKFSRQMPVGPFFADFLCREHMLIIELDGFSQDVQPDRDAWRDRLLHEHGYRVLHFSNADVFGNIEGAVTAISAALRETTHPQLLPQAGGENVAQNRPRPACGRG
ncbi:MAG: DUF559 domain-containing protein [Novosphingobium sp.]